MKKIIITLLILFLFESFTPKAKAIYDPETVTNNHFGIHIIDTSDLKEAAKLVNSNGGDWGYVTFVIQKGERSPERWQKAFDEMRRLHLIPIVRIASAPIPGNNNVWEKGSMDEIDGWVNFLNSLNWVIKNRYVIIGNEPNHASEWGNEVDPKSYANYLKTFSQKLKSSNDDFFVMPAGFDASANNSLPWQIDKTMDESLYLQKMLEKDPNIFQFIDGWASHSYPNPGFSGGADATGKGTVRSFLWESDYLKFLGFKKDLPVFITETGWTHATNTQTTNIGPKIETAYKNAWSDKRVIAITPFIFNYINKPFDIFSWKDKDGKFYDFYYNLLSLTKTPGSPIQEVKGNLITGIMPKIARVNSLYHAVVFIKNEGQSIWRLDNLKAADTNQTQLNIQSIFPEEVEPGQIAIMLITGNFPKSSGNQNYGVTITQNGRVVTSKFETKVNLIPSFPSLSEIFDYLKNTVIQKLKAI